MNTKIERAKQDTPVVINNLTLRTVNRVQPEIDKWRTYHKVAEYIEHPSRVNLYDLYDDILLDLHLSGIIGKRLRSVRNKKIRFVKDGKEVAAWRILSNQNRSALFAKEYSTASPGACRD